MPLPQPSGSSDNDQPDEFFDFLFKKRKTAQNVRLLLLKDSLIKLLKEC